MSFSSRTCFLMVSLLAISAQGETSMGSVPRSALIQRVVTNPFTTEISGASRSWVVRDKTATALGLWFMRMRVEIQLRQFFENFAQNFIKRFAIVWTC